MIALMNRIYLYCKLYQFYRHIHPLDNSCWWRHPQALYHVKVKLHEPGLDWQSIWKMSWTRGLSSDQTSFLFQLLHQLPTQNTNPESWTRTMEAVPCNNWGSAPTSFQFPWQQSCWRYIYSVVVTPGITPHDLLSWEKLTYWRLCALSHLAACTSDKPQLKRKFFLNSWWEQKLKISSQSYGNMEPDRMLEIII